MMYESDLTEAIYEVIANTEFAADGIQTLQELLNADTDYELDKTNCRISIIDNESGYTYTIRVDRTHASRP